MKFTLPLLLLVTPVLSQITINGQRVEIPMNLDNPQQAQAQGAKPSSSQGNQGSKQKDPEAFRKEFLAKLKFDRTPSGILKEESERRHPEPPKEEKVPPAPNPNAEKQPPPDPEALKKEELRKDYQKAAETFQSNVILGEWTAVREYLADLPEDLAKTTYTHLLTELGKPVQVKPRPEVMVMGAKPHNQNNYLSPDDVLALSDASPVDPEVSTIESLAKLLSKDAPKSFFNRLKTGTRYFGASDSEQRFRTSSLLLNAGQVEQAADFLPPVQEAQKYERVKELNVIARYHAEAHQKDLGKEHLPFAWELSLQVMSTENAPMDQRGEALYRALSLVSELEEGSGQDWLRKTFSDPAGEGFDILAAVGTLASQAGQIRNSQFRLQQAKLQKSAAEALLATDGIDLPEWKEIFTIYALNWLKEADLTQRLDRSDSMRPQMQYDNYGNRYYGSRQYSQNNNREQPNPIPAGDIIEVAPSDKWIAAVDETVQLQLIEKIPRLFLKVKEHQKAFPFIKQLSTHKPDTAEGLVRNLIDVWADNHNPNQQSRYRSSYSYFYGYNNRAETIPLTRSKQERNLVELSELVTSVRELKLEENFNEEFASAFITVHSQAEVWRVEALQTVFGDIKAVDGDTIASLIEKMRINLAALWPNPKLQEQFKTKRKDKELHQQVLAGYEMAREVTANAWGNEPKSSKLLTQLAALTYEESNYLSALQPQSTHSTTKRTALDDFADAAQLYAQSLPLETESDESSAVYETWFYAALGSPLLEALKNHHMPVSSEFAKIKAALDALPDDKTRERHYQSFASTLNTRLANVSPDLKYRYLEAAIGIVGDREEIESAQAVFDYYQDLITEIELVSTLDGSAQIGTEPFGLFINIHHTREIERESGGFQRYLQNQNTVSYSYNFGRPTEDYRDKFEKASRAALEENFEVVSLTFHTDKIESRTSPRIGWRTTPYAYFLLKAKGPQTDTVPPLKIDLDFLDTSGHVVLPISSANVSVVAAEAGPRPVRDLKLTMTLDERTAAEKEEWQLEVKTSANGLVPSLDKLVTMPPKGFEVVSIDDRELQVEELTTETDDGAPLSTHEYRVTLKPKGSSPSEFTFPALTELATDSLAEEDAILRQRYQDVDLLPVGETVQLNESTGPRIWPWILLLILVAIAFFAWRFFKKSNAPTEQIVSGPAIPSNLTEVSLLHWLEQLKTSVPTEKAADLSKEISDLQQSAFSKSGSKSALTEIAEHWHNQLTPSR
ncbi:MAG: hypothetical protein ACSHYB_04235 [Roseibacillus sp.]